MVFAPSSRILTNYYLPLSGALATQMKVEIMSLPKRALKFAVISTVIIMILVIFSMFTKDVIGTSMEIALRLLITLVGVFGSMWIVFIGYLFLTLMQMCQGAANKSLKRTKNSWLFAPSSLILANNFLPLSEALAFTSYHVAI